MRAFAMSLSIPLVAGMSACHSAARPASLLKGDAEPYGVAQAPVVDGPSNLVCRSSWDCRQLAPPSCSSLEDQRCMCTGRDAAGHCSVSKCVWQVEPASVACVLRH